MAEQAMPIRLNISGWLLLVVDRTEPRYVNSVTSSTECPLTDKLDVLESPALISALQLLWYSYCKLQTQVPDISVKNITYPNTQCQRKLARCPC